MKLSGNSCALAALFASVLAIGCGDPRQANTEPSKSTAPPDSGKDPTPAKPDPIPAVVKTFQTAEELEAERRKLDETVWAKERLSALHDEVFVRLWDDLLAEQRKGAAGDQFAVLKAMPIRSIALAAPQPAKSYDHAVQAIPFAAPARELPRDEWTKLIDDFAGQGYRLVQTEWHHAAFDTPSDAPPRSVISFVLYGVNEKRDERFVIPGRLRVQWAKEPDRRGNPVPDTIDATDVQVLTRTGPTAFEEILTIDPSKPGQPSGVQPVLVYDLNGDGLSEIVAAGCNRKYVNRGNGKFESEEFVNAKDSFFEMGLLADVDGDGHADFVSVEARRRNLLVFRGEADGSFRTLALGRTEERSPLDLPQTVTAGDVDGDGDLDLFLAQYKISYARGQMPTPYYDANDGFPAFLLKNDGPGKFTDVTEESGLAPKRFRRTYGSSFVDFDQDGDLDLLVVSDYSGIDVYYNDGKGHFTDMTDKLVDQRHIFGMSATFGDYNLDGRLDFYVTGMSSTTARRLEHMGLGRSDMADVHKMRPIMGYGSRMYLAQADGRFQHPEFKDQVARTGWSWGSTTLDFDNDGDGDLFVGNGHSSGQSTKDHCSHFWCHDIYTNNSTEDKARHDLFEKVLGPYYDRRESWDGYQKNMLLMNLAGKGFINIAFLLGVGQEYDARGVVSDDLDGDGRMDLVVVEDRWREGQLVHVYRNRLKTPNHWIGVRLREEGGGHSPQGARITLRTAKGIQPAVIVSGDSIHVQHPTSRHFGLGALDKVESLEVRWTDGTIRRLDKPAIDRYHEVRASAAAAPPK